MGLDWKRFRDEDPPKSEMILLARRNDHGGWGLGLGYRTVSKTWACAHGEDFSRYTHWAAIGDPPRSS